MGAGGIGVYFRGRRIWRSADSSERVTSHFSVHLVYPGDCGEVFTWFREVWPNVLRRVTHKNYMIYSGCMT